MSNYKVNRKGRASLLSKCTAFLYLIYYLLVSSLEEALNLLHANASAPICQTKQLHIVVTDPAAPPEDVKLLRESGIDVIIAPME